jgi:uncharacterized protein (TIGR03437 family)
MRFISNLATVSATVGGEPAIVSYAGLQGEFIGLDQVNLLLPRSLFGRGEVEIRLRVDGKDANTVSVMLE